MLLTFYYITVNWKKSVLLFLVNKEGGLGGGVSIDTPETIYNEIKNSRIMFK